MHSCFFSGHCAFGGTILFPHDSDSKGVFPKWPTLPLYLSKHACGEPPLFLLQGITTYEYVVAMRTQSEPPGPSLDGGDQQSLASSPTSSAVTAISGKSSLGMGLQYKGAWCTPPRIFMDHQVLPYHLYFIYKRQGSRKTRMTLWLCWEEFVLAKFMIILSNNLLKEQLS